MINEFMMLCGSNSSLLTWKNIMAIENAAKILGLTLKKCTPNHEFNRTLVKTGCALKNITELKCTKLELELFLHYGGTCNDYKSRIFIPSYNQLECSPVENVLINRNSTTKELVNVVFKFLNQDIVNECKKNQKICKDRLVPLQKILNYRFNTVIDGILEQCKIKEIK